MVNSEIGGAEGTKRYQYADGQVCRNQVETAHSGPIENYQPTSFSAAQQGLTVEVGKTLGSSSIPDSLLAINPAGPYCTRTVPLKHLIGLLKEPHALQQFAFRPNGLSGSELGSIATRARRKKHVFWITSRKVPDGS